MFMSADSKMVKRSAAKLKCDGENLEADPVSWKAMQLMIRNKNYYVAIQSYVELWG